MAPRRSPCPRRPREHADPSRRRPGDRRHTRDAPGASADRARRDLPVARFHRDSAPRNATQEARHAGLLTGNTQPIGQAGAARHSGRPDRPRPLGSERARYRESGGDQSPADLARRGSRPCRSPARGLRRGGRVRRPQRHRPARPTSARRVHSDEFHSDEISRARDVARRARIRAAGWHVVVARRGDLRDDGLALLRRIRAAARSQSA